MRISTQIVKQGFACLFVVDKIFGQMTFGGLGSWLGHHTPRQLPCWTRLGGGVGEAAGVWDPETKSTTLPPCQPFLG